MFCRKETYIFYLLFSFLSYGLLAQRSGEKQYFGYDEASQLEITTFESGEYAVVASSNASVVVLFFNACADTLWSQEFYKGDNFNRLIRAQNDNEFLYLAAALGQGQDTAIGLIKLDKSGQVLFSKGISSPDSYRWYQFHIDKDKNLYFTGNSTSTANNLASTILKLNPQGQEIHAFQYGSSFIWGMSIPAKNGGLLNITGTTLFKVDASGGLEWAKRYDGIYQSTIPPIALNDGYLIFGNFIGAIDRNVVFKIDLQGNLVWTSSKFLDINYNSATLDPSGNILISFTRFGNAGAEWGIQKISSSGANIGSWILPYSTGDGVFCKDLKLSDPNSMVLGGIINFNFANYSAIALRYLPLNLADLETCTATLLGLSIEASQITPNSNVGTFSPVRYNFFQIGNRSFTEQSIFINENNFCLNNHNNFRFDLGPDTTVCLNSNLILKADTSAEGFIYLWNTGETTAEITVQDEGLYWLEISDECGSLFYRDSISVNYFPANTFSTSFSPVRAKPGEQVNFIATGEGTFNWYFLDQIKVGQSVNFEASSAFADGVICEFIDTNNCASYDTLYPEILDVEIFMPNAFSPNGDGLNDVFGLEAGTVYFYSLDIFDRYGAPLASLTNKSWDGAQYSGGTYIYILKYQIGPATESKTIKGMVNLIR
tara:strand:- start:219898 stop:221868 length:1971 start_codon:yes stop_codon:yes gene_type:complete